MEPFRIQIPQAMLDDLHARLRATRWPDAVDGAGWEYGTNLAYLKQLVAHWLHDVDWRAQEQSLNRFAHFRANVDGFGLHFIHERGVGPNPLPILLTHGWPDSFYRFHKLIPLLTAPAAHGGDVSDAFDVIVPSLPGYGFSDRPSAPGMNKHRVASLFAALMTQTLGYQQFVAHGGDIGSGVTEALALAHAEHLIGIHLTDIPYWHLSTSAPDDLSDAEQQYLAAGTAWQRTEGAYAMLQSTKPQTPAYGLNDSPAGLAAWLVEKFRAWSDCDGEIERRFSKDELLTHIMLYWISETIGSSFRMYYENRQVSAETAARVAVPTGVAIFPKDPVRAPRDYGERFFNIQRWTTMPRGGHFAAWEEPELLVEDIRAFVRPLRS